jgi:hypothetical protein
VWISYEWYSTDFKKSADANHAKNFQKVWSLIAQKFGPEMENGKRVIAGVTFQVIRSSVFDKCGLKMQAPGLVSGRFISLHTNRYTMMKKEVSSLYVTAPELQQVSRDLLHYQHHGKWSDYYSFLIILDFEDEKTIWFHFRVDLNRTLNQLYCANYVKLIGRHPTKKTMEKLLHYES